MNGVIGIAVICGGASPNQECSRQRAHKRQNGEIDPQNYFRPFHFRYWVIVISLLLRLRHCVSCSGAALNSLFNNSGLLLSASRGATTPHVAKSLACSQPTPRVLQPGLPTLYSANPPPLFAEQG